MSAFLRFLRLGLLACGLFAAAAASAQTSPGTQVLPGPLPGPDPDRRVFRPDILNPPPAVRSPFEDRAGWGYRNDLQSRQREIEQGGDRLSPGRMEEQRGLNSEINRMNNQLFR